MMNSKYLKISSQRESNSCLLLLQQSLFNVTRCFINSEMLSGCRNSNKTELCYSLLIIYLHTYFMCNVIFEDICACKCECAFELLLTCFSYHKQSLCYIVIYMFIQHYNDTIIKTHEGRKTHDKDARRLL